MTRHAPNRNTDKLLAALRSVQGNPVRVSDLVFTIWPERAHPDLYRANCHTLAQMVWALRRRDYDVRSDLAGKGRVGYRLVSEPKMETAA